MLPHVICVSVHYCLLKIAIIFLPFDLPKTNNFFWPVVVGGFSYILLLTVQIGAFNILLSTFGAVFNLLLRLIS